MLLDNKHSRPEEFCIRLTVQKKNTLRSGKAQCTKSVPVTTVQETAKSKKVLSELATKTNSSMQSNISCCRATKRLSSHQLCANPSSYTFINHGSQSTRRVRWADHEFRQASMPGLIISMIRIRKEKVGVICKNGWKEPEIDVTVQSAFNNLARTKTLWNEDLNRCITIWHCADKQKPQNDLFLRGFPNHSFMLNIHSAPSIIVRSIVYSITQS